MSRISLLLPEAEVKPRLRCNNKDILQVKVGFNWLLLYHGKQNFLINKDEGLIPSKFFVHIKQSFILNEPTNYMVSNLAN